MPNVSPYFCAHVDGEQTRVSGLQSCTLGHKIPTGPAGKPVGVFAEWVWDGTCLTATNDRYGFYPAFYYCAKNVFAISSSLRTLMELGAPRDLDHCAIAIFLRLSYYIGNDTPLVAVKLLPPGATLVWSPSGLQVAGLSPRFAPIRLSKQDALRQFNELFSQAIERRLPPNRDFAIPLSGGVDSRRILFELCRQGYPPKYCITTRSWPPRDGVDVDLAVARQVAAAVGVEHVTVGRPSRFKAELRKNMATHFCCDDHS